MSTRSSASAGISISRSCRTSADPEPSCTSAFIVFVDVIAIVAIVTLRSNDIVQPRARLRRRLNAVASPAPRRDRRGEHCRSALPPWFDVDAAKESRAISGISATCKAAEDNGKSELEDEVGEGAHPQALRRVLENSTPEQRLANDLQVDRGDDKTSPRARVTCLSKQFSDPTYSLPAQLTFGSAAFRVRAESADAGANT